MRVLYWNIRHGGGKRREAIVEAATRFDPDLIVFGEYRCRGSEDGLCSHLRVAGWKHQYASVLTSRKNGLLAACRLPLSRPTQYQELGDHEHRVVELGVAGLTILACYFPQCREKVPVFDFVMDWARDHCEVPALVIGDMNTGEHLVDEKGKTFVAAEYFGKIKRIGFVDAWRLLNGDAREYTWFSRTRSGFRIDHAFVSPPLCSHVTTARYSHDERNRDLSDHSVLIVELDAAYREGRK